MTTPAQVPLVTPTPARNRRRTGQADQSVISATEWRRPSIRFGLGGAQLLLMISLVVAGLGPLLWLAKSAITPTTDTLQDPMGLFPHGTAWGNLTAAWSDVRVGRYFFRVS